MIKFWFLVVLFQSSNGIMVVDKVVTEQNSSLINMKIDVFNHKDEDSVLNVVFELFHCITDFKLYIKLCGRAYEDDREFKKEIFRTVVDFRKLFSGALAHGLLRNVVGNLFKNANFELRLPFEPFGILVVEETFVNQNSSLVDVKVEFFNEKLKDSVLRAVVRTFKTVDAEWLYLKVTFSTNIDKPDYNMELLNAVVDLKKLMKGVYVNPILRTVYDELKKNVDFELKFPFPPGTYSCNNFSLTDKFIPTPFGIKLKVELRVVSKLQGSKAKVNAANLRFLGEYKLPRSP